MMMHACSREERERERERGGGSSDKRRREAALPAPIAVRSPWGGVRVWVWVNGQARRPGHTATAGGKLGKASVVGRGQAPGPGTAEAAAQAAKPRASSTITLSGVSAGLWQQQ